jgi:hypothetical protein
MEKNEEHINGVKKSIDDILGADTSLRRKKKTEDDINRERFEKIIQTLEEIEVRSVILGEDLKLDFTGYDEKFYFVIDSLFHMQFGKEAAEVIFFYLYDRINADGTSNGLMNDEGEVIELTSPTDLWYLLKAMQDREKSGRAKKKS